MKIVITRCKVWLGLTTGKFLHFGTHDGGSFFSLFEILRIELLIGWWKIDIYVVNFRKKTLFEKIQLSFSHLCRLLMLILALGFFSLNIF